MSIPLLELTNVSKHFPIHGGVLYRTIAKVHAVNGINLQVNEGETLGLVGESGCGKSTLGKTILKLYKATEGKVSFRSDYDPATVSGNWPYQAGELVDLAHCSPKQMRYLRQDMQMIFQDPMDSLNARLPVNAILEEPFLIHKGSHPFNTATKRKEEILRLLNIVGLQESDYHKYPHEFSGGQRQRIGIARAIALQPKLIVCDEPVSALDVSVQSQILNLLVKLQRELGLTYLFIAHNLSVVKYIADRICVMYLGHIVESAPAETLYKKPMHPYTQALISAIPVPDPRHKNNKQVLEGDVPSPITPPSGCPFHPRCPKAQAICKSEQPLLKEMTKGHTAACHFPG